MKQETINKIKQIVSQTEGIEIDEIKKDCLIIKETEETFTNSIGEVFKPGDIGYSFNKLYYNVISGESNNILSYEDNNNLYYSESYKSKETAKIKLAEYILNTTENKDEVHINFRIARSAIFDNFGSYSDISITPMKTK